MPRSGGVYSLPAGNPIEEGDTFSATTYNDTFDDLGSAMTATVAADGQTVMTGALDMNGNAVILDADADTTIRASTDDVITFKIAKVDVFSMTAAKATSLDSLSGLTTAADKIPYTTAANTWAAADFTAFARTLVDDANAAAARTTLGVGTNTGALIKLSSQAASSSATIDITSGIDGTYEEYEIHLTNLVPASDGVNLHMLVSTDGGSSWETGASYYSWYYIENATPTQDTADAQIVLCDAIGSDANEVGATLIVRLANPAATAAKQIVFSGGLINSSATPVVIFGSVYIADTDPYDGVRILFSSGDIESGTIALYGVET